jgi:hypothetical protein
MFIVSRFGKNINRRNKIFLKGKNQYEFQDLFIFKYFLK